jgi:hypothetical protein
MNREEAKSPGYIADCKLQIANRSAESCRRAIVVRLAAFVGIFFVSQVLIAAEADPEQAISDGAKALDSWWDYPWYDDQSDDVRPINVQPRAQAAPTRTRSGTSSWGLEWLGWLLIALVVVGVLVMVLRTYWAGGFRGSSTGKANVVGAAVSVDRLEELPFQLERGTDDLLGEARRAAEAGDFDRAIVLLYSHQLLELDKRDAIRLTKGKTNRQYLRELRLHPGFAPLLATSMVAFEDVYFGGHSLGRERFEECWRQAVQLLERSSVQEAA